MMRWLMASCLAALTVSAARRGARALFAVALVAAAPAALAGCRCIQGGTDGATGTDATGPGTDGAGPGTDGTTGADGSATDGALPGSDGAPGSDASGGDAGSCDLARTTSIPGGTPIAVGAYCDDVFFCVADAAAAAAAMMVAPSFDCMPGPGGAGPASCSAGQYVCQGATVDTVDAGELAEICAVTVLPVPPDLVLCIVYI